MSVNVGELVISLKADIARLQTDMNAAKGSVQGAMKDIEQYVGYAKTAFLGLGGVLTFEAFKGAIAGAIETKARLFDLSSQTGIAVTALGALGKTGKLTGTSLDDIAAASAKLSKAVETQNEDSKGAAQAITALGLNFTQFKQLKPEEQLLAVSKAMAEFSDGTGKTAAAMLLFGKTGATLLPFLRDLAERTDLNSKQTLEAAAQAHQFEDNLKKLKAAGEEWKSQLANEMLPSLVAFTNQMVQAKTIGDKFRAVLGNVKDNLGLGELDDQRRKVEALSMAHENVASSIRASEKAQKSWLGVFTSSDLSAARAELASIGTQLTTENEKLKAMANAKSPLPNDRAAIFGGGPGGTVKPSITGLDAGGGSSGQKQADLYGELIKKVNERLAQADLEEEMGRKLSAAESLQAKAFSEIDTGVIKATLSQKVYVAGLLQEAIVQEQLAKDREESQKENDKTLDDNDRRLVQLLDETKAMQLQLDQFGLTKEQLQAVASARDRNTAAALRGRAAALDDVGAEGQLRDLFLAQADALDLLAQKKDQLAAKEAREANDPAAGAARAVREYLDNVKKAGDATYGAVQNSMKGLEDATVSILGGGNAKQAARAWVSGIISEIQRLYLVKPLLASIFGGSGGSGIGGLFGSLLGLFGGGSAGAGVSDVGGVNAGYSAYGLATGTNYVPYDGFAATLHKGEAVVPAQYNPAAGGASSSGGGVSVVVNNNGSNTKASAREEQGADGQRQIRVLIEDVVAGSIQGGGKVHSAMSGTYGLNRAGSSPRIG